MLLFLYSLMKIIILNVNLQVFEDLGDYLNSLRLMLKLNPTKIYPGKRGLSCSNYERLIKTFLSRSW